MRYLRSMLTNKNPRYYWLILLDSWMVEFNLKLLLNKWVTYTSTSRQEGAMQGNDYGTKKWKRNDEITRTYIILRLKQGKSWSISIRGNVQQDSRLWYPSKKGPEIYSSEFGQKWFHIITTCIIPFYLKEMVDWVHQTSFLGLFFFISLPKFTPFNF